MLKNWTLAASEGPRPVTERLSLVLVQATRGFEYTTHKSMLLTAGGRQIKSYKQPVFGSELIYETERPKI